ATPVTVIVLSLAWWTGRRAVQAVAALAIGAVSAFNDARSGFAILFLVAVVILWEARPTAGSRRASGLRAGAFLVGLGLGAYWLIQSLILEGALGEATQARTQAQLDESGSVILGGRPEIGAFLALFEHRPFGFGSGTILHSADVLVAKSGMADLGYAPNNGYVEVYMFGGQIELHSILGDLWAWAGFAGLVLAACLVTIIGRGTARTIARSTSCALMLFLAFRGLWDMAFSPLASSVVGLYLLLGLGLGGAWDVAGTRRSSRTEPVEAEKAR
ncbi:hypothetical protein D1825_07990, partial [Cellulomonas rhizosphaerae]